MNPLPPLPPVIKAVMLLCTGFYCLGVLLPELALMLSLWPWGTARFGAWQLLTHPLEHLSTPHLFFNLFGLMVIGAEVERYLGARRTLMLIVASTLTAGLTALAALAVGGQFARVGGISGAFFGLLLVYGMVFGERVIVPLIPPIPMRAKILVALLGGLELLMGFGGPGGAAHIAHLGGMVGAFALMLHWRRQGRRQPRLRG